MELSKFIFGDFKQIQGVVFKKEISMHQSCFDKLNWWQEMSKVTSDHVTFSLFLWQSDGVKIIYNR